MKSIRVSALNSYFDCPRRGISQLFKRDIQASGFRLKWDLINNIGATIGTAVHAGTQHQNDSYIEFGEPDNVKNAVEVGIENFRENLDKGIMWDSRTANKNEADKQINILVRSYNSEVLPNFNPTLTEKKLTAKIEDGWEMTGHYDFLNNENEVADIKTGLLKSYFNQIGGYSMLLNANGYKIIKGTVIFLKRVAKNLVYPGAQIIRYDLLPAKKEAYATLKQIIEDLRKFITTGDSYKIPANVNSILCSEKYCPAFGTEFCEISKQKVK